jgi:hypothetical protein
VLAGQSTFGHATSLQKRKKELQSNSVIASYKNQCRTACLFPKKTSYAIHGIPKPFKVKKPFLEKEGLELLSENQH